MQSSASAQTAHSRKRTRDEEDDRQLSAIKRLKTETNLDGLKRELKGIVGDLQERISKALNHAKGQKIANEYVLATFLDSCTDILKDRGPLEADLDLFKLCFADVFEPHDVLCSRLSSSMLSHGWFRLR